MWKAFANDAEGAGHGGIDFFIMRAFIESIKRSAEISKGYVGELFLLGAVLSIIILVSIIPLGLGLLISIPLSTMSTSYVYLKLKRS